MFHLLSSMFTSADSTDLNQDPKLCETEEDDEWIVVDFIVNDCTKTPEEASALEEVKSNCEPGAFDQHKDTSDSIYVYYNNCPMEDSWFITPPPCFNAKDVSTREVVTSPLENLLIEHPSMSVYIKHSVCEEQTNTSNAEIQKSSSSRLDKGVAQPKCCAASLAARASLLKPTKTIQLSKVSKQKNGKTFNRKSLKRQNLIRRSRSSQVNESKVTVHQPCQRQYNY